MKIITIPNHSEENVTDSSQLEKEKGIEEINPTLRELQEEAKEVAEDEEEGVVKLLMMIPTCKNKILMICIPNLPKDLEVIVQEATISVNEEVEIVA